MYLYLHESHISVK